VQLIAPAALLKEPGVHGVADVAPVPLTWEPAGAGVQELAPAALLKVPGEQGVDEVAPGPVA
jgi:hypothetical protein